MEDLILDIGMCNGDDSAYYLLRGHSVIGVEANPLLCAECERRFAAEIKQGRLTIINAGILDKPGEFDFYRNLSNPAWSSFDAEMGAQGGRWEVLRVICITARDLIERFGVPFFMKVDIQGVDIQALKSLNDEIAPHFVSVELNCKDPIIEMLIDLGYSDFKFVDGATYRPALPIFDHEIGWRLLRKIAHLCPSFRYAVSRLPQRFIYRNYFNPPGTFSADGYQFGPHSSGPFGDEAAGHWMSRSAALRWFGKLRDNYVRYGIEDGMWWDVHARHC